MDETLVLEQAHKNLNQRPLLQKINFLKAIRILSIPVNDRKLPDGILIKKL